MHDAVEAVSTDVTFERRLLANVRAMEIQARARRELADAVENGRFRVAEIVDDADLVSRLREQDTGMRSDVAQPAGDEDAASYCELRIRA